MKALDGSKVKATMNELVEVARGLGGAGSKAKKLKSDPATGVGGDNGVDKVEMSEKVRICELPILQSCSVSWPYADADHPLPLSPPQETEALVMTLVVRGYLKEAYVETAYRTNIYLTSGQKAYALTRRTKADVENGKGERIRVDVLKEEKKGKSRKSGASGSGKDAPSSSKRVTSGRGAKRKQIEMDGEDGEEDDDEDDAGGSMEVAMDVDDDEDFLVDDGAGPSARTPRPTTNRRTSGRPVVVSNMEGVVDDAEDHAQETSRTLRARRKGNTDERRPIGFDFENPSDEIEYMSGEEGWSYNMKGTSHQSRGRSSGGRSKKAHGSHAGRSDVIEISSD